MSDVITIGVRGKHGYIKVPYSPRNVAICRNIPAFRKWDNAKKAWKFFASQATMEYLLNNYPDAVLDEGASEFVTIVRNASKLAEQSIKDKLAGVDPDTDEHKYKTEPYDHQRKAFTLSRDRINYALFMEQGTGKTKVILDTFAWLVKHGKVNALLVVCPNSVKTNWIYDEIPVHLPDYVPTRLAVWSATAKKSERLALENLFVNDGTYPVLAMNVEAFATKRGAEFAEKFLKFNNAMFVVDESTRIKNVSAKRTMKITSLGRHAKFRRILTGTPVTQGAMDLYSQMRFLDEQILGYGSFYTYRNHFAIMGGYENKEIMGYQNLDELKNILDGYSYRVTKKECLDLPDKIYQKRHVEMTKEQAKIYKDFRTQALFELQDGTKITASIVLTKMLRLQQITGGYVTIHDEDDEVCGVQEIVAPDKNPRIQELMEVVADAPSKVIIWARFRPEIRAITTVLRKKYGDDSVVEFHGGTTSEEKLEARRAFQDPDSPVRYWVGNVQSGGIGLTLTQAETMIYYSNDFSLEARLQSEDRAHRIGQKNNVNYVDLITDGTIDDKIVKALRGKKEIASLITGEDLESWL